MEAAQIILGHSRAEAMVKPRLSVRPEAHAPFTIMDNEESIVPMRRRVFK